MLVYSCAGFFCNFGAIYCKNEGVLSDALWVLVVGHHALPDSSMTHNVWKMDLILQCLRDSLCGAWNLASALPSVGLSYRPSVARKYKYWVLGRVGASIWLLTSWCLILCRHLEMWIFRTFYPNVMILICIFFQFIYLTNFFSQSLLSIFK